MSMSRAVKYLGAALLALAMAAPVAADSPLCRKVHMEGEVVISHLDPGREAGEGLLVCTGSGAITADLVFKAEGGEPVFQDAQLVLTSIRCFNFGTAGPCKATPMPGSEEPLHFTMNSRLLPQVAEYSDAQGNLEYRADQFEFGVFKLPPLRSINILYECGGAPGVLPDYGATLNQILLPLHQEYTNTAVRLRILRTINRDKLLLEIPTGRLVADVHWKIMETLVRCSSYVEPAKDAK